MSTTEQMCQKTHMKLKKKWVGTSPGIVHHTILEGDKPF